MTRLTCLVLWFLLSAAALSPWGHPMVWVNALTLPVVGSGFASGWKSSLRLGLASAAVSLSVLLKGQSVWFVTGAWSSFFLAPLLIRWKELQSTGEAQAFESQAAELKQQAAVLKGRKEKLLPGISQMESSIQQLAQMYQLSKRFLATLDLDDGLRIVEEVAEKWLPTFKQKELPDPLQEVRALVEEGEVAVERLMEIMPLAQTDLRTRDQWGIVIGQLALGLQRIALYRKVQALATQDGLTGQMVRRVFLERLEGEIQRTVRRGTSLAFLMVDLDHFKGVNDTYGHLVGDVVLREVARLIRMSVREVDLVGRWGGEEFSVALPGASAELGFQIAERIRKAVAATAISAYDEKVSVTVSLGVAMCPAHAAAVEQLAECADGALYRAKQQGRNRTVMA